MSKRTVAHVFHAASPVGLAVTLICMTFGCSRHSKLDATEPTCDLDNIIGTSAWAVRVLQVNPDDVLALEVKQHGPPVFVFRRQDSRLIAPVGHSTVRTPTLAIWRQGRCLDQTGGSPTFKNVDVPRLEELAIQACSIDLSFSPDSFVEVVTQYQGGWCRKCWPQWVLQDAHADCASNLPSDRARSIIEAIEAAAHSQLRRY